MRVQMMVHSRAAMVKTSIMAARLPDLAYFSFFFSRSCVITFLMLIRLALHLFLVSVHFANSSHI